MLQEQRYATRTVQKNPKFSVGLGLVLLLGIIAAAGCGRGPTGPEGPAGPAGAPGLTLVTEYTNTVPNGLTSLGSNNWRLTVPQIQGKRSITIVQLYYRLAGDTSSYWTPLSDGFAASGAPFGRVSWTDGTVQFSNLVTNDTYLVQVFEVQ